MLGACAQINSLRAAAYLKLSSPDVGHGSGDSLLLHLKHPSIPRPSNLVGITSLEAHYKRSSQRVGQCQEGLDIPGNVTLYHGDAVFRADVSADHQQPMHPLDPSSSIPAYTSILALDCAYHFRTRREFLTQSYTRLAEGGRIALADICFESENGSSAILNRVIGLMGVMPKTNMISKKQYAEDMEQIGYSDIRMEDVTQDVFPGFTRFLAKQGLGWGVFAQVIRAFAAADARFVVVSGKR